MSRLKCKVSDNVAYTFARKKWLTGRCATEFVAVAIQTHVFYQTEIRELYCWFLVGEQDILRFDVAVNPSPAMLKL